MSANATGRAMGLPVDSAMETDVEESNERTESLDETSDIQLKHPIATLSKRDGEKLEFHQGILTSSQCNSMKETSTNQPTVDAGNEHQETSQRTELGHENIAISDVAQLREEIYAIAKAKRQIFECSKVLQRGAISVQALGHLKHDTPGYWTTDLLFPVGYETRAYVDRIAWRCYIEQGRNDAKTRPGPRFFVMLEKAPAIVFRSNTSMKAWRKALTFLDEASENEKDHWREDIAENHSVLDGQDGFGLSLRPIARIVEGLEHSLDCKGYLFWDERHSLPTRDKLLKRKHRVLMQLDALNQQRLLEKQRIRETARQWLEEEKAQLNEQKALHEQEQLARKRLLKQQSKQSQQQSSVQKKIEALRQRRQILKGLEDLKRHGITLNADTPTNTNNEPINKTTILLQFVEDELAKRKELMAAYAQHMCKVSIYEHAKEHISSSASSLKVSPSFKSLSNGKAALDKALTPLDFLNSYSTSMQLDLLWLWDFFYHYADALRLRSLPPLSYFCNVIALQDGTQANGESVMEEMSHGRCLATLHVILLEVLLHEYTPYLQISVADYKKTRPVNVVTWVDIARHMCMVAYDVDRGDVDGNYIKMLKGSKSSYESTILPLRESLLARGEMLLASNPSIGDLQQTALKLTDSAPSPLSENCYSIVVDLPIKEWGVTWTASQGYICIQTIGKSADEIIKQHLTQGDTLLVLNGRELNYPMTLENFDNLIASISNPCGCIFSKGIPKASIVAKNEIPCSLSKKKRISASLKLLQGKDAAIPFNHPVDAELYPDYYSIILEPMDFTTIQDKIRNDDYEGDADDIEAIIDDVHLIWKNCYEYNGDQADISKLAQKLSIIFDRLCQDYVFPDAPSISIKDGENCRKCHSNYLKDKLLFCERCDAPYHSVCMSPPDQNIPKGEWFCPDCLPMQPLKLKKDDDVTLHLDTGLAQVIHFLSKESYSELTMDDRVLILKTLCELVQSSTSVQRSAHHNPLYLSFRSILRTVEDHAEDHRRIFANSYADCVREWYRFGQLQIPPLQATPTLTINGTERELSENVLAYLKERCLAEIEKRPLPPVIDELLDVSEDDESLSDNNSDGNWSVDILERFGDEKLAAGHSVPASDDIEVCTACRMPATSNLGPLVKAKQAPETLRISTTLDYFTMPQILERDLEWRICVWANDELPFEECVLQPDGQMQITKPKEASSLTEGDILLGYNSEQVRLHSNPIDLLEALKDTCRPLYIYAISKSDKVISRHEYAVTQLPDIPVELPKFGVESTPDAEYVHFPGALDGIIGVCGDFSPWDVLYAIDGTRVTSLAMVKDLWKPKCTLLLVRNAFPRQKNCERVENAHDPDSIANTILNCHRFEVRFHPGQLGMALELDQQKVYVRSLTSMSQASECKTIQSGDMIITLQGKELGPLKELTEFTDSIRRMPRPITIGFLRCKAPSKARFLEPPPPNTTKILVAQLLRCDIVEYNGKLIVRHTGGVALPNLHPGDVITNLNRHNIRGFQLSWFTKVLQQLPLENDIEVTVVPHAPDNICVNVHAMCAKTMNEALEEAENLHQQLRSTCTLEAFIKTITPRTRHVGNKYFHFGGDPMILYKRSNSLWYKISDVQGYISSLQDRELAAQLQELCMPLKFPKTGPFSMHFQLETIGEPATQFESYVMFCGRKYYLGTFQTADEAKKAYNVCCLRYQTHQQLLAPFTNASFPRVQVPILKAEDALRRINVRRPFEPSLTQELQNVLKFGMRSTPPVQQPPSGSKDGNTASDSSQPTLRAHHENLQQKLHPKKIPPVVIAQANSTSKKRPLPNSSPNSKQVSPSNKKQKQKVTRLLQQIHALEEHKTVVSRAWAALQQAKTSESTSSLNSALQNTLTALNVLAQHISRHPTEAPYSSSFVALHHAVVMVIVSILLMQAMGKSLSQPLTIVEHKVSEYCCNMVLSALDATMSPQDSHDKAISKCEAFYDSLEGWVKCESIAADVQGILQTILTFFMSSQYLKDSRGHLQSNQTCRPLFAMLNTAQPKHIQPLPIMLTSELWKLQTCQTTYEKQLKKLNKALLSQPQPSQSLELNKPHENPGAIPKYPAMAQPNGKPPAVPSPDDIVVSFTHGPLGIIIQQEDNSITVSSFSSDPHGQAIKSGRISIGDAIVAVNHEPISVIGVEGFKQAVTSGIRPLLITFRRQPNSAAPPQPPVSDDQTSNIAEREDREEESNNSSIASTPISSQTGSGQSSQQMHDIATDGMHQVFDSNQPQSMGYYPMEPHLNPGYDTQQLMSMNMVYNQQQYPHQHTPTELWPNDSSHVYGNDLYYTVYNPSMPMQQGNFNGFDMMQVPGQHPSSNTGDFNPVTNSAFFDPQFYNPEAFRSGPPEVEFVASSSPPASSPLTNTVETPKGSKKPKKASTEESQSGRRSSRVTKKPDSSLTTTPLSMLKPTAASYTCGAGNQGEWATDYLTHVKKIEGNGHLLAILKAQLLGIEAALPRDAFRDGKWTIALRVAWAEMVVQAQTSQSILEATFLLECHIDSEFLDAHWKAHTLLTPKVMLSTATLASAALRIHALDDAISYIKPTKKLTGKRKSQTIVHGSNKPLAQRVDIVLPICSELSTLSATVSTQACTRMHASMSLPPTPEVYQKTLLELRTITQLPDPVLQRWYQDCRDVQSSSQSNAPSTSIVSHEENKRKQPTTSNSVSNVAMKKAKLRGRKPKHLEYRYVMSSGHYGIPPSLLKDPSLPQRFLWLIETLKKNPVSKPFILPVDDDLVPNYSVKIENPMDLQTVETNLNKGVYSGQWSKFIQDMELIWTNCFTFNTKQAEISSLARRMRSIFQRLFERWIQDPIAQARPNDDQCQTCQKDERFNEMLLCDSCDAAFHTYCIGLEDIPTGNWYCSNCIENRELH